jgi:hypothetical protein
MIKVNLLSYSSCEDLLNYKSDNEFRKLYDNASFDKKEATFINDSITLNLNEKDLSLGTKPSDDLESSIKIFSALKDIDLVQANDKRLWVTLTHTLFFKYAKERWSITELSSNEVIKDRFHFEGTGLRARNQNSVARLWWAAKITYDEGRSDPYELTKLLWEKQDFYQNLIDRKFSTYDGTLKGFLNFYSENKHLDLKYEMRKLFKGINAYGGVRVLSLLEEKEITNQIYSLCKFYRIQTNVA